MAIKGYGNIVSIDKDGKLWVDRFSELQFVADVQTREVDGYPFDNPDGILQTVDAFIRKETFNAQVSTGSFDKYAIARVFDQKPNTEATVQLPHTEELTVGAGGELAITGLVANQQVGVFLRSDTTPIQFTQIVSGSPTANQFSVTANTVTFAASRAGQKVLVNYFKTYTSIEAIGVSNNPIGDLGFVGRLIGTRFPVAPLFYIPKMSRFSGFNFGGETSQVTYRCQIKSPFAKPISIAFDVPLVA